MKAILMAAGIGSRISNRIKGPKCTLGIRTPDGIEMPLIKYTVQRLIERGFEVSLITGYMSDSIHKVLEGLDVRYYDNPFYRKTNSMASLWFARELLKDDDVLLMNADVFWTDGIMDALLSTEYDITMLGDVSRADNGDYFFGTENGIVKRYGKELERSERDTEYVGMALVRRKHVETFRKHLEELVKKEKYDLWWENVLYEHLDREPIHVIDVNGNFWAEVDYIEDYLRICKFTGMKVSDTSEH